MPEFGGFPTYTKQYHHEPYAAIAPTRPELSTQGKNVVITGGGGAIGTAMALSFAQSGASSIALLGRTEAALLKSKQAVNATYPATDVYIVKADVADEASVRTALEKFASMAGKKLDILVANAGVLSDAGTFNLVRAFVPLAEKNATLINVTSSVPQLPFVPGSSSYHGSKLAAVKLFDYLNFENPELRVLQFHPGVVQSSMSQKSFDSGIPRPTMDDGDSSPQQFCSLVCQLRVGKSSRPVSVGKSWDVEKLKDKAKEFGSGPQLTMGLIGWP
ncbi:hypothetical protein MKX07_008023 [Trichoderma sp. CBMAI-0711]|nr:hypothetical protein MKX07_008023 [Trichoderma sp. CBMAI-0711]